MDTDDDVIIITDDIPCSQSSTTGGVESVTDVTSQASGKGYSGFACSSQESGKLAARSFSSQPTSDVEMNLIHSQDSPFLLPSRQVSTPYWKEHPRLKRKCDDSGTPTSVQKKVKTVRESPPHQHSSNGNEEFSGHNSLEEHTYARRVHTPASMEAKKNGSYGSEVDGNIQKIQLELPTVYNLMYSVQKKEIVSITIDHISSLAESLHQSSLSSGVLADDSDTSHHDSGSGIAMPRLLSVTNNSSGSSSSIASSISHRRRKAVADCGSSINSHGITQNPFKYLSKPKVCVCSLPTCICSMIFDSKATPTSSSVIDILKGPLLGPSLVSANKAEPVVTSTSNSDDNMHPKQSSTSAKIHNNDRWQGSRKAVNKGSSSIKGSELKHSPSPRSRVKNNQKTIKSLSKVKPVPTEEEVSSSVSSSAHQCPPDCKYGQDLFVYAKWPADKIYYPAIVRNNFYTDWEYSDNLNVEFFDGAKLSLSSVNMFPASLIVKNNCITYKNDEDEYIDGIVTSVERKHSASHSKKDFCISFMIQCDEKEDEDFGNVRLLPFNMTALNDHCYKQLKKEIGESILTPHKFSRNTYDICDDNLLEGKRKRRCVERSSSHERTPASTSKAVTSNALLKSARTSKRTISSLPTLIEGNSQEDEYQKPSSQTDDSDSKHHRLKKRRDVYSPSSSQRSTSKKSMKTLLAEVEEMTKMRSRVRKPKPSSKEMASTSSAKKPSAVKGLVFRREVISEEEHSDSENEDDYGSLTQVDILTVGGCGIDFECSTSSNTSRKSYGSRFLKSSSKKSLKVTQDDDSLVSKCGPIPSNPLFDGYSFVITHGGQKSFYRNKDLWKGYKSSDMSTDYDEVFSSPYTFDFTRLKNQIIAGKGRVYSHVLAVPKEAHGNTLIISDFICRTANYLLASALDLPVYSHSLIINCCQKNISVEKALKSEVAFPFGITSDRMWHQFGKKRKPQPLNGYMVILASTETNDRLRFWAHIIHLAGGKISYFTPDRNILGGRLACASVIIVDDYCPSELINSANENSVPIVSTQYLVDTVIRGAKRTMLEPTLPQYQVDINIFSQQSSDGEQSTKITISQ